MRFMLYANSANAVADECAQRLRQQLLDMGQQVTEDADTADIIAVLGGDGTVLRAARSLYAAEKPFWSVNCGHLGYLSDCGWEQAGQAAGQITEGAYRLERRILLAGALDTQQRVLAFNELLLHRGACMHALQITVWVNGSVALRYRGDGLLISTPSGSTAYNLSAGGPVLMPEMELLALTPICAQALSAVPIVVSAADAVRVRWHMVLHEGGTERPDLTADGDTRLLLPLSGELSLHCPAQRVALVRTREADFYQRLQQRMKWNADERENEA